MNEKILNSQSDIISKTESKGKNKLFLLSFVLEKIEFKPSIET